MAKNENELTWRVLSNSVNPTTEVDANTLQLKSTKTGVAFTAHLLFTSYPWPLPTGTDPKSATKTLDHQRKHILWKEEV